MAPERENQYFPDEVSPPGETLAELLEMRGRTQADLADRTGLSKKTVNEIVKGLAPISQETAIAFERVLGVPASFWNNREQNYRESLARRETRERLKSETAWLKKIPLSAMFKLGYSLRQQRDKVHQLEEVLSFFGVAAPRQLETQLAYLQPAFRRSPAFKGDPIATAAWLRQGELSAGKISCESYDAARFRATLSEIRSLTTFTLTEFWPKLVSACASAGVAVVLVKPLPKTYVCGAARWLSASRALIQLSLRFKTDDQFWFSFFHEAAHILKHGKREFFVDENCGSSDGQDDIEREADEFARDFLIPPAEWRRFSTLPRRYSKDAISQFAAHIGVAPGIVVGRGQHDGLIPQTHCHELRRKLDYNEEVLEG